MTFSDDDRPGHDDQTVASPVDVDILVVGAGPTGLTAAAEALRRGLSVRIVERKPIRDGFSKALVVHARTMETFSFMGIDREIRELGAQFSALNLHFNNGRRIVRIDLVKQPWGDTEYPYWLSMPQFDTERVLENHLRRLGGEVEWARTLRSLKDHGDFVDAVLSSETGEETLRARWVIGADGGRSTVRDQAGIHMRRTGAGTTFLLADAKTTSDLVEDEGHMFLAPRGLLILVPMPEPRRWRVIARMDSRSHNSATVDAAFVDDLIRERTGITFGAHDITWTSRFDLSHGVAERFSAGRIFVAGDAAHVHSPVGGQGLNTGVQDAFNLIWRIAESRDALPERAEGLIREYDAERRGTAVPMVRGVARMTSIMTSPRYVARQVRSFISPLVVARPFVQSKLARGVGMLNLSYAARSGPRGVGRWREGRRLPNPVLDSSGRLYDNLRGSGYNWVIRSSADGIGDLPAADSSAWRGLPVVTVPEANPSESVRVRPGSRVILVRPDRYIAAVGSTPESLRDALPWLGSADIETDSLQAIMGTNNAD